MCSGKINKGIFSIAYLPPIEYFMYFINCEEVELEAYETYPKQTYRNRCYIYEANGVNSLHIPVIKPFGNKSKTKDVLISYRQNWQIIHWRAICSAYSNSPFFLYYKDALEPFYQNKMYRLIDFNSKLIFLILQEIGVEKDIKLSNSFEKNIVNCIDFRINLNPKKKDKKILPEIKYPVYNQVFDSKHGFKKNLSIIDLLFNKGPDTLEYIKECAKLSDINSKMDMQF